jgi:hypothetical protein
MMCPISWCATPSQRHWPVSVSREPTMTVRKRYPNQSTAIHSQHAFFWPHKRDALHPFRLHQSLWGLTHQGEPFPHTVLSTDTPQRVNSSVAVLSTENPVQCQRLSFYVFAILFVCHRMPVTTRLTSITLSFSDYAIFAALLILAFRTRYHFCS